MKFLLLGFLLISSQLSFARIIGGKVAAAGEGPGIFQIAMGNGEESNLCTATKISKDLILTAAHCFDNGIKDLNLAFSTLNKNDNFQYDPLIIKEVIIHPGYDKDLPGNTAIDLALVRIESDELFDKVSVRELDFNFVDVNEKVVFWGFGCQNSTNDLSDYIPLKKYSETITLPETYLNRNFGIYTSTIQAEKISIYKDNILTPGLTLDETTSSACFGDSGGPILKNEKVVGVNVSFIPKDMDENGVSVSGKTEINVHTRISPFKEWIEIYLPKN